MIRNACVLLSVMMLLRGPIIGKEVRQQSTQNGSNDSTASKCEATGKTEIKIDCTYDTTQPYGVEEQKGPRILLSHALITFEPAHESRMRIELTFANKGTSVLTEARTAYIEFDDEAGANHIRRLLPHVDLNKMVPGATLTFADQFLAPALQPGHYRVYLWIPSPDPKLKFEASHNLLLGNEEVAERGTGLNRVAAILVEAGSRSSRSDTP